MAIFIHNAAGPYTNQMVNSAQFTRTGTHRGNLKVRVKSAESGTDLNTLFRNSDNIYVQKDNSTAANDWKLIQRIWVKVNPEDQDEFSRTYGVEGWRLVWDPEIVFTKSDNGVQNFTIPHGVEKIYARLWGAGGMNWDGRLDRPAGNGGYTEAVIDLKDAGLTAGDKLQVVVGHAGLTPLMSDLEEAGGNTGGGAVPKRLDPRFMAFLAPYGGGGMRTRSEQDYRSFHGGGCSAIFRWDSDGASAGLESRYWPNYYGAETSAGRGDGGDNRGGGRFYTNPNHVGGTGTIQKTNQTRSSADAETLQLSMDANVLAVASGGGGGKKQQPSRPPHGGGLTASFGADENINTATNYPNGSKRATNTSGGTKSHALHGPGHSWWGATPNDHHCDAGGGSGWFGGGAGEYSTGGGVGYLATDRWGVTGKSYVGVNYLHPENTNNALQNQNGPSSAFTWHGNGLYGEEATHPYATATYFKSQGLAYPPHRNVVGYYYGRATGSHTNGGHGLVTIKFRPYTVEPEGINGIIPGQGGAPLTVSGGGPNGEHYEWPRRSGDWYFDPDSQ